ncbi:hypothetical protein [Streptomyces avermitilis]|uniref:hypothetical protein n=1 Tax=Streptomyces avermitilis TaxID=33903 RepID=UPI0036788BB0
MTGRTPAAEVVGGSGLCGDDDRAVYGPVLDHLSRRARVGVAAGLEGALVPPPLPPHVAGRGRRARHAERAAAGRTRQAGAGGGAGDGDGGTGLLGVGPGAGATEKSERFGPS